MRTDTIIRKPATKLQKKETFKKRITVAEYLLKRLHQFDVDHLCALDHPFLTTFNIYLARDPNIYALELSDANAVSCVASGYAKIKQFGACAMTKENVGFIDNILHAASESLALVTIIGTESVSAAPFWEHSESLERALHEYTIGWTILDDPKFAAKKIDRILEYAIYYQMPVCIELVQEVADMFIPQHTPQKTEFPQCDENSLQDFLLHFDDILLHTKRPVMYVGEEVFAHSVSDAVYAFSERYNIPIFRKSKAETISFQESGHDLLIIFCTYAPFPITTEHVVQIGITDAWCDERQYSRLFFKETVQSLSTLECRKVFKRQKTSVFEKENIANLASYRDSIEKHGEKREARIVVSAKFAHLFPHKIFCKNYILNKTYYTPSFALEQALGVAHACPFTPVIVVIDHQELQNSLSALYLLDVHDVHVVVCVLREKETLERSAVTSKAQASWSLTELAHLFVNGNATHVYTPKNFEKALEKALNLGLEAKEGLFLIEAAV